jgi:hypothetical protein
MPWIIKQASEGVLRRRGASRVRNLWLLKSGNMMIAETIDEGL